MLLIVHQCFLMILSRKIIVRKATLQTNKFFFIKDYWSRGPRFDSRFCHGGFPKLRINQCYIQNWTVCALVTFFPCSVLWSLLKNYTLWLQVRRAPPNVLVFPFGPWKPQTPDIAINHLKRSYTRRGNRIWSFTL